MDPSEEDPLEWDQRLRRKKEKQFLDPIDEAQSVLAGFCGILATDCSIFPISFDKWPDMPQSYFNDCFDNIIKPHFHFRTTEDVARLYVYRSIEKKWAGNRQALWNEFKDPLKTKDEIKNNVPEGIARDQWASFVNYRLRDDTQKMCKTNAENRKKQTVPHTGGSKPNSRRRAEMFAETGRRPGRAQLYLATHKKQDGSYVNEEAKEISETIQLAVSQSTVDESEISPNDVVGKVLGKEHCGRVRCLGL
ncbi:uncharacterized protein LOC132047525 [Lycium ferocissimum]|uniref:uncharacterized protein LOC132047525 n=1 Tax=Lycium ferocissimum TaxID=112874 RepID=UPI00281669FD|nr:uncharacterized protein LOC132047525 [Lycium ferocissimum]